MRGVCISFAIAAGSLLATSAAAEPKATAAGSYKSSVFMRVFGPAQPPYGFVRYCETRPQTCAANQLDEERFQPTAERLSELDDVNRSINHTIEPATDAEVYGVSATADEVADPHVLGLRCLINGETRQNSNTKNLVFDVWEQIEHLSTAMTLEPGDVIFTGTPGGVGAAMDPRQFLKAGDVMRCAVDGLGHIEAVCGAA